MTLDFLDFYGIYVYSVNMSDAYTRPGEDAADASGSKMSVSDHRMIKTAWWRATLEKIALAEKKMHERLLQSILEMREGVLVMCGKTGITVPAEASVARDLEPENHNE